MHRTLAALLGLAAAAPFTARAASSAEVLDLAGRVHYGYYHSEPRTIDTALIALDRLGDSPDVVYYRDMITIVRDRIQDMIKNGMTLAQVKAARPTRDYDARYGKMTGPWTTDMFVEAAYNSLKK